MTHFQGQNKVLILNGETHIHTFSYDLRINNISRPKHPPEAYGSLANVEYVPCSSGALTLNIDTDCTSIRHILRQAHSLKLGDISIKNFNIGQIETYENSHNLTLGVSMSFTSDYIDEFDMGVLFPESTPLTSTQEFLNG